MVRSVSGNGFWLMAGLAGGLLVADLVRPTPVGAVGSCSATDGLILATGNSVNNTTEMLWALDEKGKVACYVFGPNGNFAGGTIFDLGAVVTIGKGKKAKFSMVTGRYIAQGQTADAVYIAESTSGSIIGLRLVGNAIQPFLNQNFKNAGNSN